MYLPGCGHHLAMPPGLFASFQLCVVVPQHYHAAILHHQCNIVTHFFGVLGIRRTVILLKIWYHGIDERLQGARSGGPKRGKLRGSLGQAPLSPARRGCVRNERSFGQGGMHVSTTGLLRRFHNHRRITPGDTALSTDTRVRGASECAR